MPSPLDDATFSHTLPNVPRRESDASEGGRRRSSASSGGRFSSLNYQKRQGSGDPAAIARRESYNDQRRESGWFGGLWNNWMRGPSQTVAERRQSESAQPAAGEAKAAGMTEQVGEQARKQSWGSKHIHGTGAGAAAWRAQYPRSGSGSHS
ncbi:hypothetical protein VC83_05012 [Pseudogymnoascus destructans]|uniref:Conidiation-specific expression protein n=2 Tax=Pseudogymnoascus destructans TaxID=655981 RepID=L8G0L0_PSED2|nr:uncharacterized protein VC83_05012 [Pseudogymnoascus destructans]ELR06253.1 hypothetical protein GMDG_02048 [Pseudogymnoascus destructans 20631-21]OAF58502.1 hypothetical protein VC83_05012 [Pseudogymnoascus destructans]